MPLRTRCLDAHTRRDLPRRERYGTNHSVTFNRSLPPLATLLLCATAAISATPGAAKSNVVFICVDDLRPLLRSYVAKNIQSPNVDGLAARAFVFERADCNQPDPAEAPKRFGRFDANQDGALTREEFIHMGTPPNK